MKNREETAKQFFDTGISADSSPFLQEDRDLDDLYDKVKKVKWNPIIVLNYGSTI